MEQHGFTGSDSSIKRFLCRAAPTPRATLRLEVDPGDEAQGTPVSAACSGVSTTDCDAPGRSTKRYEEASIVLTSNRDRFGEAVLASAALDRRAEHTKKK